jgi:pullulanase/glycogen debranching enzyme
MLPDFAKRISGSGDLFNKRGRKPWASVNFVAAHDGFNLNELVSYDHKHNEANGEDNRDGHSNSHSWNHGAEGPTDDPDVTALRERQKRLAAGLCNGASTLSASPSQLAIKKEAAGRTPFGSGPHQF